MIVERAYKGLILPERVSPEEQIVQFRRDNRFVRERVLPTGKHVIPQGDEGKQKNMYQHLELRVSPEGTGELWGRRHTADKDPLILPVRIRDQLVLIVKRANASGEEKIWEVTPETPWQAITSFDPERETRRLWWEYEYREGLSPTFH